MLNVKAMKVIPEPAPNSRSIIVPSFKGPVIKGSGPLSYSCGACGTMLLQTVDYKQIQHVAIKCTCGACNEVDPIHYTH